MIEAKQSPADDGGVPSEERVAANKSAEIVLADTEEKSKNNQQKPLSSKAKRDELNRKGVGSDMDVFTDSNLAVAPVTTNSGSSANANNVDLPPKSSNVILPAVPKVSATPEENNEDRPNEIDNSKPSNQEEDKGITELENDSDHPKHTSEIQPIVDPITATTIAASTRQTANNDVNLTRSLDPSWMTKATTPLLDNSNQNHVIKSENSISKLDDPSRTDADIDEVMIVQNGVPEKDLLLGGPHLKYEYKPGRCCD